LAADLALRRFVTRDSVSAFFLRYRQPRDLISHIAIPLEDHQKVNSILSLAKRLSFGILIVVITCFLTAGVAMAQNEKPTPQTSPSPSPQPSPTPVAPAANPADVSSMDAIIAAVYDAISGPAGKKRNWNRMRSLFIPGAHLIPTGPRQTGGYGARVFTLDEYIARSEPFFEKEGFHEKEAARTTDVFGQIAHALQHLRIAPQPRRCETFPARHQQYSVAERWKALVDCNDLLARRG
jgi:hypothetical protein